MDYNILTRFLNDFSAVGIAAPGRLIGNAWSLLALLGVIQLAITYFYNLASGSQNFVEPLVKFALKFGAFAYIVKAYSSIITAVFSSFSKAGLIAGNNILTAQEFSSPSLISNMGISAVKQIWSFHVYKNDGIVNLLYSLMVDVFNQPLKAVLQLVGFEQKNAMNEFFTLVIVSIAILYCFFYVAITLFVIQVEFLLIAGVGIILIPFGVWDKTSFVFNKIKSGIINIGIKVMLMSTLSSLLILIVSKIRISENIGYEQMFYYLLGVGAFAYLAKTLPKEVDRLV